MPCVYRRWRMFSRRSAQQMPKFWRPCDSSRHVQANTVLFASGFRRHGLPRTDAGHLGQNTSTPRHLDIGRNVTELVRHHLVLHLEVFQTVAEDFDELHVVKMPHQVDWHRSFEGLTRRFARKEKHAPKSGHARSRRLQVLLAEAEHLVGPAIIAQAQCRTTRRCDRSTILQVIMTQSPRAQALRERGGASRRHPRRLGTAPPPCRYAENDGRNA